MAKTWDSEAWIPGLPILRLGEKNLKKTAVAWQFTIIYPA
jgi:hypothetical protein